MKKQKIFNDNLQSDDQSDETEMFTEEMIFESTIRRSALHQVAASWFRDHVDTSGDYQPNVRQIHLSNNMKKKQLYVSEIEAEGEVQHLSYDFF